MSTKIAIITSGHPADDERIYHKIGKSLLSHGYEVIIISTIPPAQALTRYQPEVLFSKCSSYEKKLRFFNSALKNFDPDIIICCEVFTIHAAFLYKITQTKRITIIHDITEWYPENVTRHNEGVGKYLKHSLLYFQLISGCLLCDAFLYGEKRKFQRYHSFASSKPSIEIGYFPSVNFVSANAKMFSGKELTLCYTGLLTKERGFYRFLNLIDRLSALPEKQHFKAMIIGKFTSEAEQEYFNSWYARQSASIPLTMNEWTSYEGFFKCLEQADVAIDLRDVNDFYTNSLPIKVFDYVTAGKAVIFSDLSSLRTDLPVEQFGFLVDPDDDEHVVQLLKNYLTEPELLMHHSTNARALAKAKFNWEMEEKKLLSFIGKFCEQ